MTEIATKDAHNYFKGVDPIMADLVGRALSDTPPITIPIPLKPEQYFSRIVSSIISQQISTKAAASIKGRVHELLGEITPDSVRGANVDKLRACGLSGQKVKYITHNAGVWHEIPYKKFPKLSDEEVIEELTKLYGIGRWTAEMFLMFSLARPDVFSYGDLGLMQGLYENYKFKPHWKKKITTTVERWSPYRTLASLSLWRYKDGTPVVL